MIVVSSVAIGKIIEGAMEGDLFKVRAYANMIAENLDREGKERAARIIRSKLDGSYRDLPKITLD